MKSPTYYNILYNKPHISTNYNKMKMFVLTQKLINQTTANDYMQATIVGPLGVGKSSFCIQVAYKYYRYTGLNEKDAWNAALKCVLFDIKDIVHHFKTHSWNNRAPITIMDDASIHLGSGQWFVNKKAVMTLEGLLTTARSSTKALLLNCPDEGGLMRYLRNSYGYRIYIKKEGHHRYDRVADVRQPYYRLQKNGVMKRGYRRVWEDPFSAYLPNWVFKKYMVQRDKYKEELLKKLEDKNTTFQPIVNIMEEIKNE